MTAYAPVARTTFPQSITIPRAAAPARGREHVAPPADREAQRREIERAERQRAQAEHVRDNLAVRHPLSLR